MAASKDDSVSLKEYVERRFIDNGKAIDAALAAAKEAVLIAEKNSEKWRDNANEWRGAMNDREKKFMLISTFEAYKESQEMALREAKEARKQDSQKYMGWAVAIFIAVLAAILKAYL